MERDPTDVRPAALGAESLPASMLVYDGFDPPVERGVEAACRVDRADRRTREGGHSGSSGTNRLAHASGKGHRQAGMRDYPLLCRLMT